MVIESDVRQILQSRPRVLTRERFDIADLLVPFWSISVLDRVHGLFRLILRFLSSTCTEVSGVENIGQCGRLSQLSWLSGALEYSLLTYLLTQSKLYCHCNGTLQSLGQESLN